jgi:hypothetical protein
MSFAGKLLELEIIMLSKISQKDEYHVTLTCKIKIKKKNLKVERGLFGKRRWQAEQGGGERRKSNGGEIGSKCITHRYENVNETHSFVYSINIH